jgi:hypothetical protein
MSQVAFSGSDAQIFEMHENILAFRWVLSADNNNVNCEGLIVYYFLFEKINKQLADSN